MWGWYLSVRATVPTLRIQIGLPRPSISQVLSIAPSPLAVTVTKVTAGASLGVPTSPLAVAITEVQPFIAPRPLPLAVAVTLKAPDSQTYIFAVQAEASLVGYWRLNETSGTTATDLKSANNGTYTNSPTLAQAGPLVLDSQSRGIKLVPTTSYVTIPDSAALDLGDVCTIEFFVKRGSLPSTTHVLVAKQSGAYAVYFVSDNTIGMAKSGISTMYATTGTLTDTTKWHHIAVTKNAGTVHIYLDGSDMALSGSNQTLVNNALPLIIGADDALANPATNDYMSEVAIYNTALSGATVLAHYNAAITDGLVT